MKSPSWLAALLLRLLIRGEGSEFVAGDLIERYQRERREGRPEARARFWSALLASGWSWWRPGAVMRRMRQRTRRGEGMGMWVQDVRAAGRSLRRRPGFAFGVALTLGLGIGATTTVFTVVDGVMLRPLPYDDPGRLVALGTTFPTREWADEEAGLQHLAGMSLLNFRDLSERARSFDGLAGVELTNVLLPDQGSGPEFAGAARVSPDLFHVLGATPAIGRSFLPDEHSVDADAVVMLSYGAWERRFGGDPNIVGVSVEPVGQPFTVVGVLPADFEPPETFFRAMPDFWLPLQPDHPRYANRGGRSLALIGRLGAGTTVERARDEAREIGLALAQDFPEGNVYPDGSHFGIGVNGLHQQTVGTTGRTLGIFLGAASLVLLLAAMNSATLLLARSLDRTRELEVRAAMGAGRARLVRLLVAEAAMISAVGGVVGVLVAYGGVEAFLRMAPSSLPRLDAVAVDARVLLVAAIVSVGAGVLAGLLPALLSTRNGLSVGPSRTSTAPRSRLRTLLVGGQISVAVVLLSGAGLLFSSFVHILTVDPGFEPEGLVSMRVALKRPGAADEAGWVGWDRVIEEVSTVRGVRAVGGVSNPPFQSPSWAPRLLLPGDPPDLWREGVAGFAITPNYLETIGSSIVAGRPFDRGDGPDAEPVVLVNSAFVQAHLEGEEPLDLVLRHVEGGEESSMRVVGVVENVVQTSADEGPRPAMYVPHTQVEWPFVNVVVRSSDDPTVLVRELRNAVARFSPVIPPQDLRTMSDRMASTRTNPRFQAFLIGAFASIALLLAAAGLYGTLAHNVRRREREIGVRLALGSARRGVIEMVLRDGLGIVVVGLAIGIVGALGATRVLTDALFAVEPNDPLTLAGVALVLLAVAVIACLLPARRASSVDPVEVLRSE
ncbi:MAG: ABC transporter permease [Gemmatimonadota bacterium]